MASSRYSSVIDRLSNGETILLDGATGSELEDRGVQMDNTWCGTASLEKEILKQIPLARFGKTEGVAQLIEFLITKEASYITGQTIHINGGLYM